MFRKGQKEAKAAAKKVEPTKQKLITSSETKALLAMLDNMENTIRAMRMEIVRNTVFDHQVEFKDK